MRPVEHLAVFLGGLAHFGGLSREELDTLARAMDIQRYDDGQWIIREGEQADGLYVLMQGAIEVVRVRGEREDLLNHVLAGELFGLIAMVDQGARSASCRAQGEAKLAKLPRRAFTKLFAANAEIAYAFSRALATQLARDFRALDRQLRDELMQQEGARSGSHKK